MPPDAARCRSEVTEWTPWPKPRGLEAVRHLQSVGRTPALWRPVATRAAAADRALYDAKENGRDRISVYRPAPPPSVALPEAASAARPSERAKSILLIDDDLDVLDAITRILRRAGYRVEATDDPETVILRYRDSDTRPDVLITDVMMPRMNGLMLADRILQLEPLLRVVYLSGYLQEEARWAGLPGWAVTFVAKPVDSDRLLEAVDQVLASRPAAPPSDATAGLVSPGHQG